MAYAAKDFSNLIGMEGFSETLLKNHFTLYQGYVTNTNKLMDTIAAMLKEGKAGTTEYSELKRRMGFEFNGMRLHEFYFGNLGGKGVLDNRESWVKSLPEALAATKIGKTISRVQERCVVLAGQSYIRTI